MARPHIEKSLCQSVSAHVCVSVLDFFMNIQLAVAFCCFWWKEEEKTKRSVLLLRVARTYMQVFCQWPILQEKNINPGMIDLRLKLRKKMIECHCYWTHAKKLKNCFFCKNVFPSVKYRRVSVAEKFNFPRK